MNKPFISVSAESTLRLHGLDTFDALWRVQAELVDEPNRTRGGVSGVSRLTLTDVNGRQQTFYLKRQSNYRIRTLRRPLGELTVAREFYNIRRCAASAVPTMEAAYFAWRRQGDELQGILLTRALDGYAPLEHWFEQWAELDYNQRQRLIRASAALVAALHARLGVHNCLYSKHIFLRPEDEGVGVRFIDLEKLRAHGFSPWRRKRDLDALNRHSSAPSRTERLRFIMVYLGKDRVDTEVRYWVRRLVQRSARKSRRYA